MNQAERAHFTKAWGEEHTRTMAVLNSLPEGAYDFRPDEQNRSLGEMAWHMAEVEGYNSYALEQGVFDPGNATLPELKRPTVVHELAPSYQEVHDLALGRVLKLEESQWVDPIDASPVGEGSVSPANLLWDWLFHSVHHRGQLMLLVRQAGGVVPSTYGANREQFPLRSQPS